MVSFSLKRYYELNLPSYFNQQWLSPESASSLQMRFTEKRYHQKIAGVSLMAVCVLFVDHSKIKE